MTDRLRSKPTVPQSINGSNAIQCILHPTMMVVLIMLNTAAATGVEEASLRCRYINSNSYFILPRKMYGTPPSNTHITCNSVYCLLAHSSLLTPRGRSINFRLRDSGHPHMTMTRQQSIVKEENTVNNSTSIDLSLHLPCTGMSRNTMIQH